MKILLIGIGILIVLLGIGAGVYQTTTGTIIPQTTIPYKNYQIPLIVVGVILIIIGAAIGDRKSSA